MFDVDNNTMSPENRDTIIGTCVKNQPDLPCVKVSQMNDLDNDRSGFHFTPPISEPGITSGIRNLRARSNR